jgi:hypothetical protein
MIDSTDTLLLKLSKNKNKSKEMEGVTWLNKPYVNSYMEPTRTVG